MSSSGSRATVLVVEDEPSLAELYAAWLTDSYDVRVAHSGEEALSEFDESVDVALLDRRLTDMAGEDVLAEIRKRGFVGAALLVTGTDMGTQSEELGFDEYLLKPISKENLWDAIERLREGGE